MVDFRRGAVESKAKSKRVDFDVRTIPPAMRRQICLDVLDEFGIRVVREHNGELIHGCTISPLHRNQDTQPTASLNWERMMSNCLGCKSAGTILWFIATMRDCSIEEAKVWLETSAGLNTGESPEAILGFLDAIYTAHKESKQIPQLSESMLEGWKGIHPYLTDPWGPYGRQIPEANCQRMRLGYAPEYPYAGRTVQDRIIIPHFWQGQLVGWQARKIARGDEKDPKYLASPDFPKDVTVYNYDPKAETAVVMESMLSVVSKVHLRHCEATFGAVTTEDQVRLISRHEKVILFMDNDEAGWQTIEGKVNTRGKRSSSFAEKLSAHTMVFVVQNPWDADPDEITDEDFLMLVDSAVPFALWKRPVSLKPYERG